MMYQYFIGVGAVLLLSTAWIAVQQAWRRSFSHDGDDPDVLAGRSQCRGCADSKDCHPKSESGAHQTQKEMP
jgi:hypothetical protein